MGNNGSKAGKLTQQEDDFLKLKIGRDKVARYLQHLSQLHASQDTLARLYLSGSNTTPPNKTAARMVLRRKKYLYKHIESTTLQLAALQSTIDDYVQAQVQKNVVEALEKGNRALREVNKEIGGLERVERVMGESADAIADEQQISNMLGESLTAEDTTEIDEEFERLEAEAAKQKATKIEAEPTENRAKSKLLPEVPKEGTLPMPDVPKMEPHAEGGSEEREEARQEETAMLA